MKIALKSILLLLVACCAFLFCNGCRNEQVKIQQVSTPKSFSSSIQSAASSTSEVYDKTIIIDAGHGGVDPGTIGIGNIEEKTLNLTFALKLRDSLTKQGYRVIMTRETDIELYDASAISLYDKKQSDLKNRISLTVKYPGSIYISIHQNYNVDSNYSGTQVYYSENNNDSETLALDIQSAVIAQLQPYNKREIQTDSTLYILHHSYVPTVLVECGFISNATDVHNLLNAGYQDKFNSAIVTAVNKFYEEVSVK